MAAGRSAWPGTSSASSRGPATRSVHRATPSAPSRRSCGGSSGGWTGRSRTGRPNPAPRSGGSSCPRTASVPCSPSPLSAPRPPAAAPRTLSRGCPCSPTAPSCAPTSAGCSPSCSDRPSREQHPWPRQRRGGRTRGAETPRSSARDLDPATAFGRCSRGRRNLWRLTDPIGFRVGRAAGDAEHVERPGGEGVGPGGEGVRHINLCRPRRRPQRLPTLADLPGRPARRDQQRKPAVNPAPESRRPRILHPPIGCNQLARALCGRFR